MLADIRSHLYHLAIQQIKLLLGLGDLVYKGHSLSSVHLQKPQEQRTAENTFIPSRRKDESDFADCCVHSSSGATANADSHGSVSISTYIGKPSG